MQVSIDYDNTYSADPAFWAEFIYTARAAGHDARIVTARDDRFDRTEIIIEVEKEFGVTYTRGMAKRWFLEHFGGEFIPSIWIDDKPESILANSPTSPEDLARWRAERPDGPHIASRCACGGACSC